MAGVGQRALELARAQQGPHERALVLARGGQIRARASRSPAASKRRRALRNTYRIPSVASPHLPSPLAARASKLEHRTV